MSFPPEATPEMEKGLPPSEVDRRLVAAARVHRRVDSVVKVATPETEAEWLARCQTMSNRQLEQEVKREQPPTTKKTLVFVLEGDRVEAWEQAREAVERLAGKTLSDIEAFDLLCAEALCTYATTPPFGDGEETDGGYLRKVADRDGWKCSRPGCSNRSALTANHIIPRARSGPDEASNLHTVCAVCHAAITEGRLKVRGRAPDGLTWEGPLGVIEEPLPLPSLKRGPRRTPSGTPQRAGAGMIAREGRLPYSVPASSNFGSRDPTTLLSDLTR